MASPDSALVASWGGAAPASGGTASAFVLANASVEPVVAISNSHDAAMARLDQLLDNETMSYSE